MKIIDKRTKTFDDAIIKARKINCGYCCGQVVELLQSTKNEIEL